jgi:hypothetical protein
MMDDFLTEVEREFMHLSSWLSNYKKQHKAKGLFLTQKNQF